MAGLPTAFLRALFKEHYVDPCTDLQRFPAIDVGRRSCEARSAVGASYSSGFDASIARASLPTDTPVRQCVTQQLLGDFGRVFWPRESEEQARAGAHCEKRDRSRAVVVIGRALASGLVVLLL